MKLTKKQLQQIDDYIKNNGIDYIDLHSEVLDHIASDIESLMKNRELDFNSAFEETKIKWNENFVYTASYWLGALNGGAKLFIDNCIKIYKPLVYKSIVWIVSILTFLYSLKYFFKVDMINLYSIFKMSFVVLIIIFSGSLFYWKYKIKLSNTKTSFSYLFNKQIFSNLFISLIILGQILDTDIENIDFFDVLILLITLAIMFIGYSFYKKHIKIVSNYKKYC